MAEINAKFISSAFSNSDWINDDQTEVVFIGRSNVGKSSLINALAKNSIARVSKTPGRTQLANFYDFNSFRLIDLPGYGYAKVAKTKQVDLVNIIDGVLTKRKNVYCVFQICDANVITQEDVAMSKYLDKRFVHHYIVLNKCDKRPMKFYLSKIQQYVNFLKTPADKIILISAKERINISQFYAKIKNTISEVK